MIFKDLITSAYNKSIKWIFERRVVEMEPKQVQIVKLDLHSDELLIIVKIWNEDKFLFSFYFCLFSFSNGIIKTGKSKKKIEICFHSKCRLYY